MDESRPSFPAELASFIGDKKGLIAVFFSSIFRVTANLGGIPAVSIPVGLSKTEDSL
ncbi:MAG: hypothetical protein GTO16_06095 [Candidatus Aminicenantes bacterium]|nr:hypothetical protein [Candidatus Aminicenantes bacterium]